MILHEGGIMKCLSIKWLKYCSVPVMTFNRCLRKVFPLLIVDVNGKLQYFNHCIDTYFISALLV